LVILSNCKAGFIASLQTVFYSNVWGIRSVKGAEARRWSAIRACCRQESHLI